MNDMKFSTLWGSNEERATENWTPFPTDEAARRYRDEMYMLLRKQGKKARRWTMKNQIRQYWSFGVPCGDCCNVYHLTISNS